ncbi:phosphatase PAP2 family protein [Rothia kristinae]|uniref:phosphatase PAP2 family protein n=1 Tax=Rothia kristinae TaxID=37923 RepID=UPI0024496099|nr:phosphatase PAP2 family protein [Rothia kristinae]WGH09629.1 phosphatase PAP2 family protein [Rothia kristinae]
MAQGSRRRDVVVGTMLLALGAAGTWRIWDWEVEGEHLALFDHPLQRLAAADQHRILDEAATAVTWAATPELIPILAVLAAIPWFFRTRRRDPLLFAGAVVLASVSVTALKVLVARTRPPTAFMVDGVDRSFSFPSGHTCLFATAALVLAWLLTRGRTRGQRLLAFAVAVLASGTVAASRIYLGYHWLTDVCASLGIAVALLGAVMLIDAALPRGAAASGPSRRRGRVRPARDGAPVPE